MAMALMQDIAWKPSFCCYCLLQTPIHQSLQNKGKKVENNINNNIKYSLCSKKSNNLVIIYCYSIGRGTLKTFMERKGPPPKVKKKFFKDKECKEKLLEGVFLKSFLVVGCQAKENK
jgi:hypothetical protein